MLAFSLLVFTVVHSTCPMMMNAGKAFGTGLLFTLGALGLLIGGVLIGQLALAPVIGGAIGQWLSEPWKTVVLHPLQLILGFTPSLILLYLFIEFRKSRAIAFELLTFPLESTLLGAMLGAGLIVMPTLAAWMSGAEIRLATNPTPTLPTLAGLGLGFIGLAYQSFVEEAIFRGWLLQQLRTRIGVLGAILFSSGGFAAAHTLNPGVSPLLLLNLFLAGTLLAVLVVRTGSLWPASVGHACWNWMFYQGIVPVDRNYPTARIWETTAFQGIETEATGGFLVSALALLALACLVGKEGPRWKKVL